MKNSLFKVRKVYHFEAAHQLVDGSCSNAACSATIHGHSFKVELVLSCQRLDRNGMVMDLDILSRLTPVVDKYDHALILPLTVPTYLQTQLEEHNSKIVVVDFNPTAENLAMELYYDFVKVLSTQLEAREGDRLHVESVRLHETEGGWAEFVEPDSREELIDGGEDEFRISPDDHHDAPEN